MTSLFKHPPLPQTRKIFIFPLKTVLFPDGLLSLRVFEPRYVEMVKLCLRDDQSFGVCRITEGEEVGSTIPSFASIGSLCRIVDWDMQQLGILLLKTIGGQRFQVRSHEQSTQGLIQAEVTLLEPEVIVLIEQQYQPLARLLQLLIERIGAEHFPAQHHFDDSSWVSYRLAEILPLKASIKQNMLEINDSVVRLQVLAEFVRQQGLV